MRFFLHITFCILLSLLTACTPARERADLVVAIESDPSSLDPRYPTDAYSAKLQQLMFNGLLAYDENLELVPDLAEFYRYLSPTKIEVVLKPNIRFHDGEFLTPQDVAYTFESILKPGSRSPLAGTFQILKEIEIKDERTLIFYLKKPFAPFLTALTIGIVPHTADQNLQKPFREYPVGTGPFRFAGRKPEQWIALHANENYFAERPKIKTLQFSIVRDDTTRVLKLIRGEVDLVQNALPLMMVEWLLKNSDLQLESDVGINYNYLAFNLRDPILKDQRVRLAIAMAINRQALITNLLKGFARPATGILAPSSPFYEPKVSPIFFDVEAAKGLLDAAGYPDPDGEGPAKRFTLTYKTSNRRDRVLMARAIARQLEGLGIEVKIESYEWGTFFRDIRTGNFQMYTSTWVGVTDPDIYYLTFHSASMPPDGANRGGFVSEVLDELLSTARTTIDPEKRRQLYAQVQQIVALELPYVSLWYEDNVVLKQPGVQNYSLRPDASFLGLVQVSKTDKKD